MRAVRTKKGGTALERFATRFHQDFGLIEGDFDVATTAYMHALLPAERHQLAGELRALLGEYPGAKSKGLRDAWLRLGAEWAPRGLKMRAVLDRALVLATGERPR